ncbi:efflux RND transporter periplasmic adaptor subunit [Geobacter pickeringii]|uniref:RND transporter n=1 Tax=Geobacter pickeringii TaxID=345632 RepID=A0A0B5BJY8_9BACT|nr:efflux RND transporter periplasmic adaptor subunit [Geobacter pickeringii]AJE04371.1 RND transporter [Geobacter pickeringii]
MTRGKLCVMILPAVLAMAGCGAKEGAKETAAPAVVTGVPTEAVAAVAIPEGTEAVGTVRARNAAVIAARLAGTVSGIFVREGDRVGKGKLLVTLDAAESAAQAAGARATEDEARRGVDEARAHQRLADTTFARYQNLYAEQAVTRQEFDNRRADKEVADQGVERAVARLAAAREGARAAGMVAGYGRITAPLTGVVTARQAERGMTVFPGSPLLTVEEMGSYRLEAAVPESEIGRVKIGARLPVAVEGAGVAATGRVAEVVPAADPGSRTFTVKVDLSGSGLRSGMFGRVFIPTGERNGISVPKGAVVERGGLTSVWVVDGRGIARMRLVKCGKPLGGRIEILSGVTAGERVVTGGTENVVEGARIQ